VISMTETLVAVLTRMRAAGMLVVFFIRRLYHTKGSLCRIENELFHFFGVP
jgi:hypothetical protein